MMARAVGIGTLAAMGLGGCDPSAQADAPTQYSVIDRLRIDDGLINILAQARGPEAQASVDAYAECVIADYALEQGFGFARRIRTQVTKTGGNWRADAVYSISKTLPDGLRTIDTEIAVQNCADNGIPTG